MANKTPLQRLREERKKTLKDVADAVGTDTGNLSRVERGKQCSVELAARLVDYYGRRAISELEILYPERYPGKQPRRSARAAA